MPPKTSRYSVNRGLWGTTIGGAETHVSDGVLPEDVYVLTCKPWPIEAETIRTAVSSAAFQSRWMASGRTPYA